MGQVQFATAFVDTEPSNPDTFAITVPSSGWVRPHGIFIYNCRSSEAISSDVVITDSNGQNVASTFWAEYAYAQGGIGIYGFNVPGEPGTYTYQVTVQKTISYWQWGYAIFTNVDTADPYVPYSRHTHGTSHTDTADTFTIASTNYMFVACHGWYMEPSTGIRAQPGPSWTQFDGSTDGVYIAFYGKRRNGADASTRGTGLGCYYKSPPTVGGHNWMVACTEPTEAIILFALKPITLIEHSIAGVLDFVGTFNRTATFYRLKTGTLSFSGIVSRTLSLLRSVAGTLSLSGAISRTISLARSVAGALSFNGTVSAVRTFMQNIAGVLSLSGNITQKIISYIVSGTLPLSGSLTRWITHAISGALSFSGTAAKVFVQFLTGVLGLVGAPTRTIMRTLAGILSFEGIGRVVEAIKAFVKLCLKPEGKIKLDNNPSAVIQLSDEPEGTTEHK